MPSNVPETRYARSGDLSIAYQVVGSGPPDILFIPGFVSNVELMWEVPFLCHYLRRFARRGVELHVVRRERVEVDTAGGFLLAGVEGLMAEHCRRVIS